tara:strand:+ start:2795 stop:3259 length:465 start_codon:yes stop_codon:yes gene_type:complete
MELCVTRFNNETYLENKNFREKHSINCLYSTPVKITDNILPNQEIIILEMNNTNNSIEGIGIIQNKLYLKEKYRIYSDKNYNRYTYKSKYRIDKKEMHDYELIIIKNLEKLIFKSPFHCKRGQGIQMIPKHIKKNKELNYCKILNDYIKLRFNK